MRAPPKYRPSARECQARNPDMNPSGPAYKHITFATGGKVGVETREHRHDVAVVGRVEALRLYICHGAHALNHAVAQGCTCAQYQLAVVAGNHFVVNQVFLVYDRPYLKPVEVTLMPSGVGLAKILPGKLYLHGALHRRLPLAQHEVQSLGQWEGLYHAGCWRK